jgi:predicted NodU family carbamoyl transferase
MLTLGLRGSNHDYAACFVEDGIVCGAEEERLTRRKYSKRLPRLDVLRVGTSTKEENER